MKWTTRRNQADRLITKTEKTSGKCDAMSENVERMLEALKAQIAQQAI